MTTTKTVKAQIGNVDVTINTNVTFDEVPRADGVQYMYEYAPGKFSILTYSCDSDAPPEIRDKICDAYIQSLKDAGVLTEFPKYAS